MVNNLRAVRRISQGIGYFWVAVTYFSLILITVSVFWYNPALLSQPRGWLIFALAVLFGVAYTVGYRFFVGINKEAYWRERMTSREHPQRGILFWAVLIVLVLLLSALEPHYVYLLWVPFGVSLTVMSMPRGLLLVIPTSLLLFISFGWLPHSANPGDILAFIAGSFGFGIYAAILYLPFILLRERFAREHMFMELEQSHRALEDAHQQLADSAERDRELAVLRERGRLARDLHDTLGHSLVLASVKLEAALRLRDVDPARADHEIMATQALVRTTMSELRQAIADLRAPLLDRESLSEVLSRRAREMGLRAGLQVIYDVSPDLGELDGETYEALLRVGTEALANVERHAHARTVTLHLARQDGEIVLRVADDGVGIPTPSPIAHPMSSGIHARATYATADHTSDSSRNASPAIATLAHPTTPDRDTVISSPAGHYGIIGMRERVTALGGHFAIGPGVSGSGTCVGARLPARSL